MAGAVSSAELLAAESLTQIFQPLRIDLTAAGEVEVVLPFVVNAIWIPPQFVLNGGLQANPADAVIAVRINNRGNAQIVMGFKDGCAAAIVGAIGKLFVRVLTPGASQQLYLQGANGIAIQYVGPDAAVVGAYVGGSSYSMPTHTPPQQYRL